MMTTTKVRQLEPAKRLESRIRRRLKSLPAQHATRRPANQFAVDLRVGWIVLLGLSANLNHVVVFLRVNAVYCVASERNCVGSWLNGVFVLELPWPTENADSTTGHIDLRPNLEINGMLYDGSVVLRTARNNTGRNISLRTQGRYVLQRIVPLSRMFVIPVFRSIRLQARVGNIELPVARENSETLHRGLTSCQIVSAYHLSTAKLRPITPTAFRRNFNPSGQLNSFKHFGGVIDRFRLIFPNHDEPNPHVHAHA